MPPSTYQGAIHCVTTWSKFDMTFDGVSVDTLLDLASPRPEATFVMARSHTGYTTNLSLSDVTGGKAWVAWAIDGKPLPVEHGGPARLLVPHLYFWKSAKWVSGLTLMDHDEPGLWERSGYHDRVTRGSSSATKATDGPARLHGHPSRAAVATGDDRRGAPGDTEREDIPAQRRWPTQLRRRPALHHPLDGR
jgi:DMSO/TMAO reductase YedYZ molybdopterin-dependent catalytic subunit